MRRILILALLLGGMQLILPLGSTGQGSERLLTFGFLILGAYTVGEIVALVGLPRIVGHLAAGVVFGPAVFGAVSEIGITSLTPVSELAIALIAFLAGAELRWSDLRGRGVLLIKMTTAELLLTFVVLAAVIYLLQEFLPFLAVVPPSAVLAAAILFAAIAIVHSPAVTMALLSETGARGPVARTTLGIVLLADVAVVILFSCALAVARVLAPPTGDAAIVTIPAAVWQISGALVVGALLGGAVALYLRFVGRELILFAVLVSFFGIEIARVAQVELLLTMLTAGFAAENLSPHGDALRKSMERSAAPIFVVFFALSGAKIDVAQMVPLLPLVIPIAVIRAGAIWAGTQLGARWAGARGNERRLPWMGLVSQAGVAIGLATIVAEAYGEMGAQLRNVLLALIAVNETAGAILFRRALVRSGEAGRVEPAPVAVGAPGAGGSR